jgi:hypothetical protein
MKHQVYHCRVKLVNGALHHLEHEEVHISNVSGGAHISNGPGGAYISNGPGGAHQESRQIRSSQWAVGQTAKAAQYHDNRLKKKARTTPMALPRPLPTPSSLYDKLTPRTPSLSAPGCSDTKEVAELPLSSVCQNDPATGTSLAGRTVQYVRQYVLVLVLLLRSTEVVVLLMEEEQHRQPKNFSKIANITETHQGAISFMSVNSDASLWVL